MLDQYETHAEYSWLGFATTLANNGLTIFSDSTGALYLPPEGEVDHIVLPSDVYVGSYPAPEEENIYE